MIDIQGKPLTEDLLALLEPLGFMHVDGVPTSNDDQACQAIIDACDVVGMARMRKDVEIQAERDRRREAGYLAGGYRFHSDAMSRIQQLGLRAMGQDMPPGIMWKTKGQGYVAMTPILAAQIFAATAAADVAVHTAGEQKRAALAALQSIAEIEAFDVATGWPEV